MVNSPRDELTIHSFSKGLTSGGGHFSAAKSFKNPLLSRTACRPSYASVKPSLLEWELSEIVKTACRLQLSLYQKKIPNYFQSFPVIFYTLFFEAYVTAREHMHQ